MGWRKQASLWRRGQEKMEDGERLPEWQPSQLGPTASTVPSFTYNTDVFEVSHKALGVTLTPIYPWPCFKLPSVGLTIVWGLGENPQSFLKRCLKVYQPESLQAELLARASSTEHLCPVLPRLLPTP